MSSTNTSGRLQELLKELGCLDDAAPYDTPLFAKRAGELIGQSAMRRLEMSQAGQEKNEAGKAIPRRETKEVSTMDDEKSAQQSAVAQKELLDACQQTTQHWLDRMQSEMALWANLGSKLATTRSVPEACEVYGKCISEYGGCTTSVQ